MKYTLILVIMSVFVVSCSKPPEYPPEPQIDFKFLTIKDTTDLLGNVHSLFSIVFKILDGDGNFGFKDEDVNNPEANFNNFKIDIYIKKNNIQTKITNDTINYDGKIPWVKPVGLNKYYKSTVIYDLDLYFTAYDSIRFEFYVLDRQKNQSNIEKTMWVARNFKGTIYDTNDIILD